MKMTANSETQKEMLERISGSALAVLLIFASYGCAMIATQRISMGSEFFGDHSVFEGPQAITAGIVSLAIAISIAWISYFKRIIATSLVSRQGVIAYCVVVAIYLLALMGTLTAPLTRTVSIALLSLFTFMFVFSWFFHELVKERIKKKGGQPAA